MITDNRSSLTRPGRIIKSSICGTTFLHLCCQIPKRREDHVHLLISPFRTHHPFALHRVSQPQPEPRAGLALINGHAPYTSSGCALMLSGISAPRQSTFPSPIDMRPTLRHSRVNSHGHRSSYTGIEGTRCKKTISTISLHCMVMLSVA